MDETEFQASLREHDLALDEGNVIGGPFIPDGRYRIYEQETHGMVCDAKTYDEIVSEFESWLRNKQSL